MTKHWSVRRVQPCQDWASAIKALLFFSGCPTAVVDGKTVCIGTAENYTFKCSYSLADQTVTDNFDVSGQDTQTDAENTGTLGYTLEVRSGCPLYKIIKKEK